MWKRVAGLLAVVVIATLLFASAVYVSPYVAIHNLRRAFDAKDADTISHYVDYPSLRESLRTQVEAPMAKGIANNKANDPLGLLESPLVTAYLDALFDQIVTPEGIAGLFSGGTPEVDEAGKIKQPAGQAGGEELGPTRTTLFYEEMNKFVLRIESLEEKSSVDLAFHRHGLFSWKLSSVRFTPALR